MEIIIPKLEHALSIRLKLGTLQKISDMRNGNTRMFIDVIEGSFEGPQLHGIVIPGTGGDYPFVGTDGVLDFDARYMLREDDGSVIYLQNRGFRWGKPEIMKKLSEHEQVDPSEYYMVTAPKFEVAKGRHDWLARYVFVGKGRKTPDGNVIDYFKVL